MHQHKWIRQHQEVEGEDLPRFFHFLQKFSNYSNFFSFIATVEYYLVECGPKFSAALLREVGWLHSQPKNIKEVKKIIESQLCVVVDLAESVRFKSNKWAARTS